MEYQGINKECNKDVNKKINKIVNLKISTEERKNNNHDKVDILS